MPRDLAARLGGVVFVGQAALGERLDLQRVGLGAVDISSSKAPL
jgi:hypothetical protein